MHPRRIRRLKISTRQSTASSWGRGHIRGRSRAAALCRLTDRRAPGEEDFGRGLVTGLEPPKLPYDPIRCTLLIPVLRIIARLVTNTHSNLLRARAIKHKIAAGQPAYLVASDLYQVLRRLGTWIRLAVDSWGGSWKSTPGS